MIIYIFEYPKHKAHLSLEWLNLTKFILDRGWYFLIKIRNKVSNGTYVYTRLRKSVYIKAYIF